MNHKARRTGAMILAMAILSANTAYASQVLTATAPGNAAQTVSTGTTYQQSGEGYVNSGPGTVGVFAQNGTSTTPGTGSTQGNTQNGTQETQGNTQNGVTLIDPSGNPTTVQPGMGQTTVPQTGTAADPSGSLSNAGTTGTAGSNTSVSQQTQIKAPEISSEAGVLYDATTGQFLFDKEGSKPMYPASITKLMTALLAVENLSLEDTVVYTATATQNLESGAANVNLTTGDMLSVKDSLYALLLKSACEVANGLAEKVSGSQQAFAEKMNQRASQLGATGTHFENASGLNGASHYTTARDMALIAHAAISNETIKNILQTRTYKLPASKNRSALTVTNGNKMINPSNSQYYEGIVGGKTGYTSKAGNTLVEAADVNGHRLIAVVMKSNSKHYDDVKLLFDYGKALIEAGVSGTQSGSTGSPVQVPSGGSGTAAQPGSQAGPGQTTGQTAGTITPGLTGGPGSAGTTGTTSGVQSPGQSQGTQTAPGQGTSATTGFVKTDKGTQYVKSDGSICKNEWLDLLGKSYFFDGDGYMCTGWIHFANGDWYYFDTETGEMLRNKWITDTEKGKSYYVGSDGVLATNTVIDGQYRVNEKGEYVENVG